MGVYIKKMKMPRSCVECRLLRVESNDELVGKYCPLVKRYIDWSNAGKHRCVDCWLVEVTEPHGRLIDELNVIAAIRQRLEVLQTHKEFIRKRGDIDLLGVIPYITKIPTVIKGSED